MRWTTSHSVSVVRGSLAVSARKRSSGASGKLTAGLDGIEEMVDLQRKYGIFAHGRRLRGSIAIMNPAGFFNPTLKQNWYN